MPPRTRAAKLTKGLKENIGVVHKTKAPETGKGTKPTRKALADKTNSASDDNASIDIPVKVSKKATETVTLAKPCKNIENNGRPRRERRLPTRFVENSLLKNLSNGNNASTPDSKTTNRTHTPAKSVSKENPNEVSPFKTPQKPVDTSLVANRPRRICRLPSKFEDHSMSPSRFITVQPVHASTPKLQKINSEDAKKKAGSQKLEPVEKEKKSNTEIKGPASKQQEKENNTGARKTKNTIVNKSKDTSTAKPKITKTSVNEVNVNKGRTLRGRKVGITDPPVVSSKAASPKKTPESSRNKSPKEIKIPRKQSPFKKHIPKDFTFRVLEDKPSPEHKNPDDIYEFTFDPTEEPPPQKKTKRRAVKRKPAKPKTVIFKNNFDKNISKTLTVLRSEISKKPQATQSQNKTEVQQQIIPKPRDDITVQQNTAQSSTNPEPAAIAFAKPLPEKQPPALNNKSVQIEDIAAEFEVTSDHQDINYSPVNSPHFDRPKTPALQVQPPTPEKSVRLDDPLNLREELSFFDEQPIASSSMNVSVRHPEASPWRVEFETLPIKWHVNSYTKPNMTPAVECSFVNFEDNKKKHVYTNIVPQSNDALPQIVEKETPNLVQTSIISFIKEVVERNSAKKQRARSRSKTPTRNYFNEELASTNKEKETTSHRPQNTRHVVTPKKNENHVKDKATLESSSLSDKENSSSSNKENSRESLKRKSDSDLNVPPAKTPKNDWETYFGFDDSKIDQENISPENIDVRKPRTKSRPRAVLKESNVQGPTRAMLPLAPKTKNLEAVNRMYEEMKSAADAPVFPEKDPVLSEPVAETTNVDMLDDDSQSVHLFEDVEVVHHAKPHRKSYGKAKKVTFRQLSISDSDTQENSLAPVEDSSEEEDNLDDLTFEMPTVQEKKAKAKKKQNKNKQKLTKKEREEAEAWAASFNSMCEDVEEFPLLVE